MYLGPIPVASYSEYVRAWLAKKRRSISEAAIEQVYEMADQRTFHMQQVLNRLWDDGTVRIGVEDVIRAVENIQLEQQHMYYRFRALLADAQWRVLVAMASSNGTSEPYSQAFRNSNNLPAPSTVKRALDALVDRELIVFDGGKFKVEDPFLASWIRSTFRHPSSR
jgi:hypothetical protein